jgi:hypothetical protein
MAPASVFLAMGLLAAAGTTGIVYALRGRLLGLFKA